MVNFVKNPVSNIYYIKNYTGVLLQNLVKKWQKIHKC